MSWSGIRWRSAHQRLKRRTLGSRRKKIGVKRDLSFAQSRYGPESSRVTHSDLLDFLNSELAHQESH